MSKGDITELLKREHERLAKLRLRDNVLRRRQSQTKAVLKHINAQLAGNRSAMARLRAVILRNGGSL